MATMCLDLEGRNPFQALGQAGTIGSWELPSLLQDAFKPPDASQSMGVSEDECSSMSWCTECVYAFIGTCNMYIRINICILSLDLSILRTGDRF